VQRDSRIGEWFGIWWQEFSLFLALRCVGDGGSIVWAQDIQNNVRVFNNLHDFWASTNQDALNPSLEGCLRESKRGTWRVNGGSLHGS
jgi:hypothetical protein